MTIVERMARAMALAEYNKRICEIRKSHETDRPISFSGPLAMLDYLCSSESEWDIWPYSQKIRYFCSAIAALEALKEPSEDMMHAMFEEVYDLTRSDVPPSLITSRNGRAFISAIQAAINEHKEREL